MDWIQPLDPPTTTDFCDRCGGSGALWSDYYARSVACADCDGDGEWEVDVTCASCGEPATCQLVCPHRERPQPCCEACAPDELAAAIYLAARATEAA